ncbi:MAG: formylglycine-generating enzyme family protein [Desulfobacteraceae bacterium]|nr:formylglycine-generating enzyme family protein [Desulfobacteraceae bacterium]
MGRDARGLYVKLDDGDDSLRIDWPEWSERGDVDEFGLYAEFDVGDVLQRMRWINPGTFMMGSPDDEPERQERERWHRVTLTRGFWLADTACTQALWEAVMGKNPNRSKWKKRPVEEISWDDCMEFIRTLNNLKSGLDLRLPTEAEWEYACRAGTGTPFSLGNNITPDQVNYNGEYPYAGAEKGNFIGESVDVGSIPANPWGLYEMHGNVWEWCSDWFDDYPVDAVVDPVGPETGVYRVLRGGSWIYDGRDARSAYRNMSGPGNRSRDVGFRLARGQKVGGAG